MKAFKKFLVTALTLALALPLSFSGPEKADAQSVQNVGGFEVLPFGAEYRSQVIVAADTDVAVYVKYFPGVSTGNTGTTTVAAAANGDLTFVVNGAAYAGFECPVSGALGGVIDVSDAACNTLGEVVDIINATSPTFSTGYFRAVIAGGLRTDSSDDAIVDLSASTTVSDPGGAALLWDSSTNDDVTIGLFDTTRGIRNWIPDGGKKLPTNPFADSEQVLQYFHAKVTNAGTIGNYEVYCVVENYKDGKASSSETTRTVYLEAGAATTVVGKIDEFLNAGGLHCQGGKLLVRALASGADTTAFELFGTGYVKDFKSLN